MLTGAPPYGAVISSSMNNASTLGLPSATQAPFLESECSSVPNSLSSLLRVESAGNQTGLAEPGRMQGQLNFDFQGTQIFHPRSLPEYHNGLKSVLHCNSLGSMTTNTSQKPLERIDNRQSHKTGTDGRSIEFNDGGKCNCFQSKCFLLILGGSFGLTLCFSCICFLTSTFYIF